MLRKRGLGGTNDDGSEAHGPPAMSSGSGSSSGSSSGIAGIGGSILASTAVNVDYEAQIPLLSPATNGGVVGNGGLPLHHRGYSHGTSSSVGKSTGYGDFEDDKGFKQRRQAAEQASNNLYIWIIPSILTILALWTRLYKISWSNIVVWDEAHFGKFATYYIRREFYFDVHPPLGKMLLGLAGILSRYNGSFLFDSGHKYPDSVNYTGMRIFSALFGAFMVPLAYFTALQMKMSKQACILTAAMVLMDLATLTISRFILLDSMLLFFTALSLYCLCVFRNYQQTAPLSTDWYIWLAATGASIGAVSSVKWVGLFAIALVGLHTLEDLWEMFGDVDMPKITYIKHWLARILCLIILPVSIYALSFYIHFWILNKSGTGDAQMSSLFQAGLEGNTLHQNPLELAYGSKVSIKNTARGGGLLHSHIQKFPSGSGLQQVTCYHHKDNNNEWYIRKPRDQVQANDTEFVKNGDIIRLVHAPTGVNLHSSGTHHAPMTAAENEVSGYGNETTSEYNDLWMIEIKDDFTVRKPSRIRSLTTRFFLKHVATGCLLRSTGVTLPQWGFKQIEVVCQKKADRNSIANMWNIEQHWNPALPSGTKGTYRRRFWKDFADLNVAMWSSNNALTPDPDNNPDALTSSPYQWPFALVGLRMCGWGDNDIKFFLLGHPIIWWGSSISLMVFAILFSAYLVRFQRKFEDWRPGEWDDFFFAGKVAFLGWFLHYIPFWIMGRVTYLHHYFPALYFAIFMFTFTVDHLTQRIAPQSLNLVMGTILVVVAVVFFYFADFAFGIKGPAKAYKSRQWLSTWHFYD
ncbi:Dolichyl-phosphate-mannose-protein mannosyltransferase-domain-containing protein [Zopfochytrium polystomum]|nr:Dolichyl-phosphate-mannose-protein mannosyltransferase-domain-containing protein [Zopfochytrium polystomum]